MKKLLIILLLAGLFACQETPEKSSEAPVLKDAATTPTPAEDTLAYREVAIPFSQASINMPAHYTHITLDEIAEIINASDLDEEEKLIKQGGLQEIRSLGNKMIYADTANIFNFVIFVETEYIYISRSMGRRYLGMVEQSLEREWSDTGDKFEKLDSKYLHSKKKEIIKAKYKLITNGESDYYTQYIVSGKDNSLIMIAINDDNMDLEPQIKTLEIL
ncbi:hypothetical protein AB9P05_18805 [Roseivirga sp. BDSF3-8]|uniref:hypothetical protein n=1 Tax=Roseivirga sp. BDSF3-8 TaxID=3241598 RepID=UPI0035325F9D